MSSRSKTAAKAGRIRFHTKVLTAGKSATGRDVRAVTVPADFQGVLTRSPKLKAVFDGLSYTKRRIIAEGIAGAKTAQTRERRIQKATEDLKAALAGQAIKTFFMGAGE